MNPIELESWALRVLEGVEGHQPTEDSRVELKKEWLDPIKAARRLAGHANAARGNSILWLIGVDEKHGLVNGANYLDLANWLPQVRACFESEVPALQDLNITYKTKTVAALCFDTSRFPYVVKNPKGGEIQFEVPWRDGTAVRSATRSDLVVMLTPLIRIPKIELLGAELRFVESSPANAGHSFLEFSLTRYVVQVDSVAITFPFHKCSAVLTHGNDVVTDAFRLRITTPRAARAEQLREAQRWELRGGGGPAFP